MDTDPFRTWLDRWRLTPDGAPFSTKYGSRLMPVLYGGEPAMLKIAEGDEERRGAAAMVWYAGEGAARVLAHEDPALLLERVTGPRSLAQMARSGADDLAARIICQTTVRLHAPRAAPLPSTLVPLQVWFRQLAPAAARAGGTFAKADAAARALLASPREVAALHGDVHHDNILDGGARGWLAIDPKGLIGERGFDYANLFRNPDAAMALAPGRMRRLVGIVVEEASVEPVRLLTWILAYAGLGAAWSLDSGHDADASVGLAIAEIAAAELAA